MYTVVTGRQAVMSTLTTMPFSLRHELQWKSISHSEEEVFVDTVHLPQLRRKIQKLSAQDPGESKRRWIKVTEALAKGDEQEAADAKHEVGVVVRC